MFSKMNEKMKAALFFAIGMGLFLVAGSIMHIYSKSQNYIDQGTTNVTKDTSSSIQELYQNLAETDPAKKVSMVEEIHQYDPQPESVKQAEIDENWILYVTGSVKNPGVYRLPKDSRVFQLVDAAGGLSSTADVVAVNMAARLQDGDHLHVPKFENDNSVRNRNSTTAENRGTVIFTQGRQRDDTVVKNQRSNTKIPPGKNIDLNTASTAELQMLPGIGPAMSKRIVQYREKNGKFKRVSDLINVSGIGAKKLESIEPFLFVR
jgi:competence protein ComEA